MHMDYTAQQHDHIRLECYLT